MRLEQALTYWKISGYISSTSCLTRDRIDETDANHVIDCMTLKNQSMQAHVLCRCVEINGERSRFALIHADILFRGFPDGERRCRLFRTNVSLADLIKEFSGIV